MTIHLLPAFALIGSTIGMVGGITGIATWVQNRRDRSARLQLSIKAGSWNHNIPTLLATRVIVSNPSTRRNTIKHYRMLVKQPAGTDLQPTLEDTSIGDMRLNALPLEIAPGTGVEVDVGFFDLKLGQLAQTIDCVIFVIDIYGRSSSIEWSTSNPARRYDVLFPSSRLI